MTSDTATPARAASEDGAVPVHPTPWQRRLLRFGYSAAPRKSVRERLVPPMPKPSARLSARLGLAPDPTGRLLIGWGVPLLVTVFAGLLRFWHLGSPHAVIFDETYYAKDSWSLLHLGYEGTWPDAKAANAEILGDPQRIPLESTASYIVHPPVGKWMIAMGEWMFGLTPFGWRFVPALLGTLSVLMVCRIGRRLFRSTALGCLAGALMAVDGLHFVMSRTALLDIVVMFWVVAAFGCLLVDRDKARARLARALPNGLPDDETASRLRLGVRPWRIAAGVCLGLAAGTKWNGLYVLMAFAVMTVLWDMGARRTAGARQPFRAALLRDAPLAFSSLVPVAIGVYIASWVGWFATGKGYFRDWANTHPSSLPGFLDPLRSLWHYHAQMYDFHTGLHTPHTYQSNPWSWLLVGRPVSYFYESAKPGKDGCAGPGECAREVLAIGTPLLWWTSILALAYMLFRWALRRDWRAGAILCGVAAGYLPWFMYQSRTIFYFYAVVFVPFLCLAVAMAIGALVGSLRASERRRMWGSVAAGVLVLLIVWNFIYFFPLFTGDAIPMDAWRNRMWLETWI
ncbi:dolichyl-phosphate-mannose--protein mannosyltransferase [Wenjunlia tyrosinilytica]|uniref:Polyprenol-phosphate-mannose--protein mannosyltransferase n=1 Tax=Wenjunlia tyrosinilytica TaxID=1544741 RepID=A0A917ZR69_9ACTN|nr:phospholipid carrier-dependent glycosyltransferase [Wenjunlia tyrosinilytica]GGO88443.1 phospholipid carrier-dependent glycosyltransferase [Wenjunlia tyrosinilytica]